LSSVIGKSRTRVGVHDAAEAMVEHRLLMQRHSDAPDDAAHDLAVAGLGVEDAAGGDRADHPRHASDIKSHLHFRHTSL
jgi:hypothetical protein